MYRKNEKEKDYKMANHDYTLRNAGIQPVSSHMQANEYLMNSPINPNSKMNKNRSPTKHWWNTDGINMNSANNKKMRDNHTYVNEIQSSLSNLSLPKINHNPSFIKQQQTHINNNNDQTTIKQKNSGDFHLCICNTKKYMCSK